jgi:sialate O-acetylesterase
MKSRLLCFAAVMVCFATVAFADVRLPEIFDNNMVLQRDMPIPIWGWAEPGEEVSVRFEIPATTAETVLVTANANGKWSTQFPPLKASTEPAVMTIKGKNEIKLTNVLVGDVWLCSGQSNMEWSMTQSDKKEYEELLKTVDNPNLRLFHVRKTVGADPRDRLVLDASWKQCAADAVPNFSAVALHFGRKLQKELNVPIGLINSSWGGTRIEPWTPPAGFQSVPALKNIADEIEFKNPQSESYKKLAAETLQKYRTWLDTESKKESGRIDSPPTFPNQLIPYRNEQQPTTLYNAMIHPFVPFAMKGAIWYQGESNMGEGMLYAEKMKALIQGWRTVFNNPDLGFYYVQLAPFDYGEWPYTLPDFWEIQGAVEKLLPKTGQVIINDTVDDYKDIHPPRKQLVGERLALLALNRTYGRTNVVGTSPELDKMVLSGRVVELHIKNARSLRTRDGESPNWFELAGEDGVFHKANAMFAPRISGPVIMLTSPDVAKPVAVRHGWHHMALPNVINEGGLPLGAFRSGTKP